MCVCVCVWIFSEEKGKILLFMTVLLYFFGTWLCNPRDMDIFWLDENVEFTPHLSGSCKCLAQ